MTRTDPDAAALTQLEAKVDALARRLEAVEARLGAEDRADASTLGPAPEPVAANPATTWPDEVDDNG